MVNNLRFITLVFNRNDAFQIKKRSFLMRGVHKTITPFSCSCAVLSGFTYYIGKGFLNIEKSFCAAASNVDNSANSFSF